MARAPQRRAQILPPEAALTSARHHYSESARDEIEPGVIVDYGPEGQVVGFDLMDAQRRGPWADWMQCVDALQTRVTRS